MRVLNYLVAVLFVSPLIAEAQGPPTKPLSPRIANYDISVTLDDAEKRITGDILLTWHNPSDDSIGELPFHLYINAFKDARSTWVRE